MFGRSGGDYFFSFSDTLSPMEKNYFLHQRNIHISYIQLLQKWSWPLNCEEVITATLKIISATTKVILATEKII